MNNPQKMLSEIRIIAIGIFIVILMIFLMFLFLRFEVWYHARNNPKNNPEQK